MKNDHANAGKSTTDSDHCHSDHEKMSVNSTVGRKSTASFEDHNSRKFDFSCQKRKTSFMSNMSMSFDMCLPEP